MRNLFKTIFILFSLFTFYSSFIIGTVHAQVEFETTYKVNYLVKDDGKTEVTQNITLTNKKDNSYADRFELRIGSTKVENVKAQDSQGEMETNTKFEDNVTTINVRFNARVIGLDKTLPWTLTYTTSDLASKSGQIWDVSIPRLAKSPEITSYDAKISIPISFGELSASLPKPKNATRITQRQEYIFDKDQLFQSGIAMSFGKKQVFSFQLDYFIENQNLTNQFSSITLPPDNNYQKVVIEKIEPAPENVEIDRDGNFLAKYKLAPKEQKTITAAGYVEVFAKPFRNINAPLNQEDRQLYTQAQTYWETDNAFIKDKAQELKNPTAIYDFVSNFLKYNNERLYQKNIKRKGAAAAIGSQTDSVCTEFTDLFIALARAAGIPAREVEGYAYTQNDRLKPLSLTLNREDILHAWPEYWDEDLGWVQVDPTWGSTSGGLDFFNKLDFNHITFVHRGISSNYPYPAGAYKKEQDQGKKSVHVEFAKDLPEPTSIPELLINTPEKILSGIPVKITATIKNTGSTSIISSEMKLTTSVLEKTSSIDNPIKSQDAFASVQKIPILPPFGKKDFVFSLQSRGLLSQSKDNFILSFDGAEISKPVLILPIYQIISIPNFAISITIAILIISLGLILYVRLNRKN